MNAFAQIMGSAFASGLAEHEDERGLQEDRAGVVRAALAIVRWGDRLAENRVNKVVDTVRGYVTEAFDEAKARVSADPLVPARINYQERYAALKRMQNSSDVLRGIELTLDLARDMVHLPSSVDVNTPIHEAMDGARAAIGRLGDIVVDDATVIGADPVDGPDGSPTNRGLRAFGDSLDSMDLQLAEAARLELDRVRRIDGDIDVVADALIDSVRNVRRQEYEEAQLVAGGALDLDALPQFDAVVDNVELKDASQLAELEKEVRQSFGRLSEIVADNGVMAAFCNERIDRSTPSHNRFYGIWDDDWLDDDDEVDRRRGSDSAVINYDVDNDKHESIADATARMHEFNQLPYDGFLDIDFHQHVNAFWYGFDTLMFRVNRMFPGSFQQIEDYRVAVTDFVDKAARELARHMDENQAADFCKQVGELKAHLK